MAKLLAKDEVKTFTNLKELKEFNKMQEDSYTWISFKTRDGQYVPLEDVPILVSVIRGDLGVSEDVSDDTLCQQMTDTKLVFRFPSEEKSSLSYPVGPTAYRGLLQRIGATCPALTALSNTRVRTEVNPVDKAEILNKLVGYTKGSSLVLVGDELVLADLSDDYVRLPFSEILRTTEKELKTNFELTEYVKGTICHESSSVEFMFRDNEIDNNLFEAFNRIGIDVSNFDAHIKVLTSDVGLSGANIYPFIKDQCSTKMYPIGTPLKLEHIGTADMEKFKANLLSCFASFKDVSEHLEKMKSTMISNPADCLYNVGKKIQLPEKQLKEIYEEFDSEYPYSFT